MLFNRAPRRSRDMKVFIFDLCRICPNNRALSACLRHFCEKNGYEITASPDRADFIVFNGCNVLVWNLETLDYFRRKLRPGSGNHVVAIGCAPPMDEAGLEKNFHYLPLHRIVADPREVDRLFGARHPFKLIYSAKTLGLSPCDRTADVGKARDFAHIMISDGCLAKCSFFVYPQIKGSLRSMPAADILRELDSLRKKGKRKIVLVTDDAAVWGRDIGSDIFALLAQMVERAPDCRFGLRFHPAFIKKTAGRLKPFWNHFIAVGLPLQSGSDRLLRLMRRGYTVREVLDLVSAIRKQSSNKIWIHTDMLIGFPTETDEDFEKSLQAAEIFDTACFFSFAAHSNTPAGKMKGQIPKQDIQKRIHLLKSRNRKFLHFEEISPRPSGI